jgi:hypothetical protein
MRVDAGVVDGSVPDDDDWNTRVDGFIAGNFDKLLFMCRLVSF